jgi:hypothetical protein
VALRPRLREVGMERQGNGSESLTCDRGGELLVGSQGVKQGKLVIPRGAARRPLRHLLQKLQEPGCTRFVWAMGVQVLMANIQGRFLSRVARKCARLFLGQAKHECERCLYVTVVYFPIGEDVCDQANTMFFRRWVFVCLSVCRDVISQANLPLLTPFAPARRTAGTKMTSQ